MCVREGYLQDFELVETRQSFRVDESEIVSCQSPAETKKEENNCYSNDIFVFVLYFPSFYYQ